jgi:hypothetical protein
MQYAVVGPYVAKLVDDRALRDVSISFEDFGNYGTHLSFPEIPSNEIWIAANLNDRERFFSFHNALKQLLAHADGFDEDEAYWFGLREERRLREQYDRVKMHPENVDVPPPPETYVGRYGKIEEVDVFIVSGELVRDLFKTDYIEGGHGYVYSWIPNDEIWLEDSLPADERPFVLLHEFVERTLMKRLRLPYGEAHTFSATIEFSARRAGWSKRQIDSMTSSWALSQFRRF